MTAAQTAAKAKFKKAIEYRKKTGVSLKEAFAHVYGKKVGAAPKKKAAPKKTAKKVVKKAAPKKAAGKKIILLPTIGSILNFKGKIWGIDIGIKQIKVGNEIYFQLMDETNNKPIIKIIPNLSASELDATAYDITEYIKYYTPFASTAIEMQKLKEKLKKWVRMVSKEVNKLNKKTAPKKAAKKVVKKAAPKKAARKKHTKYGKVKAHTRRVAGLHKDTKSHNVNIRVVSGIDKTRRSQNQEMIKKYNDVKNEISKQEQYLINWYFALKSNKGFPANIQIVKTRISEIKKLIAELKTHARQLKKYI
jgi:hypothetical protein